MLFIPTSFWVRRTSKSWSKHFFSHFSTIFVHFKPFSVISWRSQQNIKKKHFFCSFSNGFCLFQTSAKKCFDQLLSARRTQKLVEIHNNRGIFFRKVKMRPVLSQEYTPITMCCTYVFKDLGSQSNLIIPLKGLFIFNDPQYFNFSCIDLL